MKWAIAAFILIPATLMAQDFRPGYIIKSNGDSLSGLVRYRTAKNNTETCVFKESKRSDTDTFSPDRLKKFGFYGDKQFVSLTVRIKGTTEKVFARALAIGAIDLYAYNKSYLIYKDSMMMISQDQRKIVSTGDGLRSKTDKTYVGILNFLIRECQMSADHIKYSEEEITHLIDNYNRCKGQEPFYKKPRPFVQFDFEVFSAYLHSNMKMDYYDDVTMNPSKTVAFGIGTDLSSPRIFDRIFLSLEAWYVSSLYQGYTEGKFNGDIRREDIIMDFSYIKAPISLRYNFLKEANTPYFKLGFVPYFLIEKSVKTLIETETGNGQVFSTETYGEYDFRNPKGLMISVGYDKTLYRNLRLFGEVRYENSGGFVGTAVQSFSTLKNFNFMLGIRIKRDEK